MQKSRADNCDQATSDLKLICALNMRPAFTVTCCSVASALHMLLADLKFDRQACPHHLVTHQCHNKKASKKRTVGHFMDLHIFFNICLA